MTYIWPRLHLMELTPAGKRLALAAKAVFPAVYTNNYNPPEDMDAVEWLDAWKDNVTEYDHFDCRDDQELTRLCNVLRQCTNLKVVCMVDSSNDAAVVEAVMATARSIEVAYSQRCATLLATLARWLASGHAEHLCFEETRSNDDEDDEPVNESLAQLFAQPTTLSSLALCLDADGILGPLVAVARSFPQLVSLRIDNFRVSDTPTVLRLLHELNTTRLRSLDLGGNFVCSVDALLGTLASLTALEELRIMSARILDPAFETGIALTIRRVKLFKVEFSEASWQVFSAHVAHLEEFTWHGFSHANPPIETICVIGDEGAFHLAGFLPRTTSSVGAVVDINCPQLSARSYVAFGEALASCSGISIALPPPIERKMVEAQTALRSIQHRYGTVDGRLRLVLESHAMPAI
ncbi:hypothetical protein SPRG_04546 [Saprolegnia parasitica CBS 223.65]|uniref:Leucine-rich repeat domain, L domain-like n=1 Tax=Saprolegnia parasitica (strain CBS 223.65) TaxID=695850 RepID=A0A067CN38_SAPPC|nr:hypothetical protein SPRG_04546 [Saprolegnia parasitica CBS 223.65]KDO30645.1 hypothetical protein SPRG_04546 [Saprolegnia parasitica CBS 223.65]|eukprot:XP_012198855.1 hypothetical protein SPRG_04546 [Saprolegnia parasitica CBS 223.65]